MPDRGSSSISALVVWRSLEGVDIECRRELGVLIEVRFIKGVNPEDVDVDGE